MGYLKLIKLKQEGKLQKGDQVRLSEHGDCTVSCLESTSALTVKVNGTSQYVKVTGLVFGHSASMGGA